MTRPQNQYEEAEWQVLSWLVATRRRALDITADTAAALAGVSVGTWLRLESDEPCKAPRSCLPRASRALALDSGALDRMVDGGDMPKEVSWTQDEIMAAMCRDVDD